MRHLNTLIASILFASAFLIACGVPCFAVVWFDDGETHAIDYQINEEVQIWDNEAENRSTTVNLIPHGVIGGNVILYLNSSLNIYDGELAGSLSANDSAQVTMSGGLIRGSLVVSGNSQIGVTDGQVNGACSVNNDGRLDISGGVVGPITLRSDSHVTILGGRSSNIVLHDDSQLEISGGVVGSLQVWDRCNVSLSGGTSGGLFAYDHSHIVIVGSHFRIDDAFYGYGNITNSSGQLTGKFPNGDKIDNQFAVGSNASILLVPEHPITSKFCSSRPLMDANKDCKVDMADLAVFASEWLTCGMHYQEACWQ